MANDQLNLFTLPAEASAQVGEIEPKKYAVVFYSCRMEDQFGDVWERKEIVSSGLSKDAAENLAKLRNSEVFRGKSDRYEVEEITHPNFLIS